MGEDSFARKLAELGAQFRAELPRTIEEMRALAAKGAIGELRMTAHRMAGRGGTFGAPAVGEAARRVEEAETEQLAAALDALAAEVEALR